MAESFIHLSDIHFGQEKGGDYEIHNDAREQLIRDVGAMREMLQSESFRGVIVTGDVAYSGKKSEYQEAGVWLDQVCAAAGCEITEVQVVPGNHDVDRDQITWATDLMLEKVREDGESALDRLLESDADSELLFKRFSEFQLFARGYKCQLDHGARSSDQFVVPLSSNRSLRFVRLNSALTCSSRDEKGKLLLGARQRVLRERPGEELVILSHHPISWFMDSDDTRRYVRSRARVFISGHEHAAAITTEVVEQGRDLLMMAAGAVVPPSSEGLYGYCYNIVEFDCDAENRLLVKIVHRVWDDEMKRFSGPSPESGFETRLLGSPNFRAGEPVRDTQQMPRLNLQAEGDPSTEADPLLLLRFFRDLSAGQRLLLLTNLGAIPESWNGTLSEPVEREFLDELVREGRRDEVWESLKSLLADKQQEE